MGGNGRWSHSTERMGPSPKAWTTSLSPDIVGANRLDVADMHGKHFIQEIVTAARSQTSGWVTYMRENPNTGQIEHKIAYWQMHDGLIFKAGTYQ
jgi:signal transduction histidine kinase